MHIPKNYFHDRFVLVLLSVNVFLVIAVTLLTFLRLDSGDSGSYIISYRSNLGLDAFSAGTATSFVSFVVLGYFVFLFHTYLSMRLFEARKRFAIAVLALATLLLVLILVVTNALFVLR
jgi:hypothetical protein